MEKGENAMSLRKFHKFWGFKEENEQKEKYKTAGKEGNRREILLNKGNDLE